MSCEDTEIDGDVIIELLLKISGTVRDIFLGGFSNDTNTVIEQLAFSRRLFLELDDLKETLIALSTANIYCFIINSFDLQSEITLIEDKFNDFILNIETFDNNISNISFDSFAELESIVDTLFDSFEDEKEILLQRLNDHTKSAFSVLSEIGANQDVINDAVDNVLFTANIREYITEVFNNILDQTIATLPEN